VISLHSSRIDVNAEILTKGNLRDLRRCLSFPLSFSERGKIMTNQTDNTDVLEQKDDPSNSKATEQAKMDRIANELAERAIKIEQRYDREHGIFTK
jgi:hypothetical protein